MVKIAIIHNIITPYRLPLFRELAENNKLIVYYCVERYGDREWNVELKENYKYKILSGFTFRIPVLNMPCSLNPSLALEIFREDFDSIIVNGFTDLTTQMILFGSLFSRKKIILWSELTGLFLSKYGSLYLPLIKLVFKIPDAFVVPSTTSKNFHIKMGVSPEKIFLSPNVIDNDKYYKISKKYRKKSNFIKKELNLPDKKIILFVGRLIKRKGIIFLLDAYAKLKNEKENISLVIIGDGPIKDEITNKIKSENIKDVILTGFLNEKEIIKYYSVSNVLVLPSTWELHPLVITEAMSCGLPVIATEASANALDLIQDFKNGFILKRRNINDLVKCLEYTLNNSENMGRCSIKTVNEDYNLTNSVNGIIEATEYSIRNI